MAAEYNLVGTILEDDDVPVNEESTDSEEESITVKKRKKSKIKLTKKNDMFDEGFQFVDDDDEFEQWGEDFAMQFAKRKRERTTLDEKIAKQRRLNKRQQQDDDEVEDVLSENDESEELTSEDETKVDPLRLKGKKKKKKKQTAEEDSEQIIYSEEINTYDENLSFQDMNLSRPLMKALSSMNFSKPTPIQVSTIPVALLNKDVCACAATGTGKTAAFMLPVLERLLYKPRQAPVTRVLVLAPTRELAVQIHQVSRQLAQYTNVDISLSAGGLDVKVQEASLRLGPDVVIATPGRLIDHLHNAPNFNLSSIEILILDEADRMLDEYFADQMKEVIRLCSRTRQTMLFSATMTEEVNDLAAVSLRDPVKIFMNENKDVAMNLKQEFIRIRDNREGEREAIVAALLKRTFPDHTLVFIQTKVQAHRMHILLGLLGIKVGELHGNLQQIQRLEALKRFKDGDIDVLLATDLASRGLDIQGIRTVMNFTMPNTLQHYIHRVGRTARAGMVGRAISLVNENERKIMKELVKRARHPVKSRVVPGDVVAQYKNRIKSLEGDIKAIQQQEEEEKLIRGTEDRVKKATKMLDSDAQTAMDRTWFQTHKERKQSEANLRLGEYSNLPRKKLRKMGTKALTPEDRAKWEVQKSALYSVRASKKRIREGKVEKFRGSAGKQKKGNKSKPNSTFERELTNTGQRALKKYRAGPSYEERKELGICPKKSSKGGGKFKSKGGAPKGKGNNSFKSKGGPPNDRGGGGGKFKGKPSKSKNRKK